MTTETLTEQLPYPTPADVEIATLEMLAFWVRFLPTPGARAHPDDYRAEAMAAERAILNRITVRFGQAGGWTPALSKRVGWTR